MVKTAQEAADTNSCRTQIINDVGDSADNVFFNGIVWLVYEIHTVIRPINIHAA
jgi:hypothetical protein